MPPQGDESDVRRLVAAHLRAFEDHCSQLRRLMDHLTSAERKSIRTQLHELSAAARKGKKTLFLEDVLDPGQGWDIPRSEIRVATKVAADGNLNYELTLDRVSMLVFEQRAWTSALGMRVAAARLVVEITFTGVEITDLEAPLEDNQTNRGLPCFALNEEGNLTMNCGIVVDRGFSLDDVRKQLMICIGLMADLSASLLQQWNKDPNFVSRAGKNTIAKLLGANVR